MALVMVSAIGPAHGAVGHALVYGTLLGCDLGPNLTTTGSLSTMLWLLLLRQRGLEISSLQYLRLGVIVTPLILLATAPILAATEQKAVGSDPGPSCILPFPYGFLERRHRHPRS